MNILVQLHSIWRWLLLVIALVAILKAFAGWLGKQPYARLDRQLGMYYMVAVDIQVLIGLIIWIIQRRFTIITAGEMGNAAVRFFAVEHPFLMVLALILAHVGYNRSRRGNNDTAQHRTAAIFYLISFILILAGIPWDRVF